MLTATAGNQRLESLEKRAGRGFDAHAEMQREARPERLKNAGLKPRSKGQRVPGTTTRPGVLAIEQFAATGSKISPIPRLLPDHGRANGIGGKVFRDQSIFREDI